MPTIQVIAGIMLLYGGGELLVNGGIGIGKRLNISPMLVGLTVVSFGTSLPELATSIYAALLGSTEMAMGNIIGSNISNIGLVLGLAACVKTVSMGAQRPRRFLWRDLLAVVLCAAVIWPLLLDGKVDRTEGLTLLAGLVVYLYVVFHSGDRSVQDEVGDAQGGEVSPRSGTTWLVLFTGSGCVLLVVGADLLVRGGVTLAKEFDVSEAVIGLTVVALGTSLPELASTLVACARGETEMAIGNVIGSNIFNVLCVLGLTAAVTPVRASGAEMGGDLLVLGTMTLVMTIALVVPRGSQPPRLRWTLGAPLVVAYISYCVSLYG